ncbi:7640_t:CDS:2 [Racocetra persica]|uniref:7640_t:CDS:1 n=1 Tax=Racocetra persica TaxID=160502 RepID=A0ACA9LZM8_9GLOM|nr:7640_t:CDS:2 [Racocetra persica]
MNDKSFDYGECLENYDPDIDYEILDHNESYLENTSEISSTPKTTTDESVMTDHEYASKDFTFDERALNHAKNFVISTTEHLEQDENNINAIDYEIEDDSDTNTNNLEKDKQYVVVDYQERRFQHCLNNIHRQIKQLIGTWELDF